MRFPWPPSEEESWILQTYKNQKQKTFFLPLQKQDQLLLGVRIQMPEVADILDMEIPVGNMKAFKIQVRPNVWTTLPYPIEQHAIGTVWEQFDISASEYTIELAYFPWNTRNFRMRALVDKEGEMILAYRISKKGQTILYMPPKDHIMTLPEDTYILPRTDEMNTKSITLYSAQAHLPVKKNPESRYFNL